MPTYCRYRGCAVEIPEGSIYCPMCGRIQLKERLRGKRPNGSGTVYKLSGARRRPWVAAKNKAIIGYYESKAAALAALDALSGQPLTDKYNMTFAQVREAWKKEAYRKLSEKGKQGYDTAFKHFTPLHDKKMRSITVSDVQEIMDLHSSKSKSMQNKLRQLIGQMCKWAMREKIITLNLAQYLYLDGKDAAEKEIFTDEEIAKLEADGSETARIVLMMIYTGMRISELFLLKKANYHITYCIGGVKTEAGRDRIIPIPTVALPHFEYFAARATELLLDGHEGNKNHRNYREREYKPKLAELGIRPLLPHSARHTFATKAVRAGVKPETLQRILGHADYSLTADTYYHEDAETLVDATQQIWNVTNK